MESRVYVCCWDNDGGRWWLWVRSVTNVTGEGASFNEAEERLRDAVISWCGDGEAVFDFDPPLELPSQASQYSQPNLVLIAGDTFPDSFGPQDALFTDGICSGCNMGLGERSEVTLSVGIIDSGFEGGFTGYADSIDRHFFSESFLSLLRSDERSGFEFRAIERGKRARKRFFEFVAMPQIPFVGVRSMDASGWECQQCGGRALSYFEPAIPFQDFVCGVDLPNSLPSVFPVGQAHSPQLCMTTERWSQLVGCREAQGITSSPLGVVNQTMCERHPRLTRHWSAPCATCTAQPWFDPSPNEMRFQRRRIVRWIIDAANAGDIVAVREPVDKEDLFGLLNPTKPVEPPIVFSFRCPECWRLGRIVFDKAEVCFQI